ncbi:apolipoprotein N-acyltransferase [Rhodococcus globerulus]|uniref:apolipoprotein N-acyltransferase n=1 Tax=Rhodococcus globerulus TaxID=33008 RepID=UPI001F38BD40|nr:apolipoprotein N-acyltransferase [Rhodococcus globerulus]MCE4263756.1 apolipoprotein N-acyltransferase [Rhodococcus globerulus]
MSVESPAGQRSRITEILTRSVWLRSLYSAAGGYLIFVGFPPRPLWFLAPVGIALLTCVLTNFGRGGLRLRAGFGYGYLAGLGFLIPLLPWIGVFVGAMPWIALAAVESLFIGLFGLLAVLVSRLPWAPLWIAAIWSLTEWLRSSVPFGGFPWGRLAFGQSEGLLLPLASLGGAPLLSFGVALTGTGLAAVAIAVAGKRWDRGFVGAVAASVVPVLLAVAVAPFLATMDSGEKTITVAAIQGSVPRLGLDFNSQRKQVLDNHVTETLRLADEVDAGRVKQPDIVIWPENASDIDPLRNVDAAADITRASVSIGAPILVGTVLVNADRTTTNSVIVWDGNKGPQEQHDKKIIQPFGEYLPYRDFFRKFSEYADRAGNFVPGDGNGVVHAAGVPIGIATCYEVAFDRAFQESVRNGAQLLAVPTNNATFGDTEMTYQQLAMSRVRAVEHGRAVVVAATSGVSAIISPDGSVTSETDLFVPEYLVADVPLSTDTTLATKLGPAPEVVLCLLAAGSIAIAVISRRREPSLPETGESND